MKNSEFGTFHPIVNFIYFAIVIFISMFSMNPIYLGLTYIAAFIFSVLLKGVRAIKFNLGFTIPVILIMTIINTLSTHNGATVFFYLNNNAITKEALLYGIASSIMLSSIIIWFSCYNEILTSDKLIYLFGRIVPVVALTISMSLRFIPLLKNRFREINQGQKCMGRDISSGSIIFRIRLLLKEISILIAWSLEESIETSNSMEARGYGIKGRTSFHLYYFEKRDLINLMIIILFGTLSIYGCMIGINDIYYYPIIIFPKMNLTSIVLIVAYLVLLIIPIVIEVKGDRKWKKYNLKM